MYAFFCIDELIRDGVLEYSQKLFTPDESSYLNYMFNDAVHSNARALRNQYDNGNELVSDSVDKYSYDYYLFLALLIGIMLKINEEFAYHSGCERDIDFIEWPLYGSHLLTAYDEMLKKPFS